MEEAWLQPKNCRKTQIIVMFEIIETAENFKNHLFTFGKSSVRGMRFVLHTKEAWLRSKLA